MTNKSTLSTHTVHAGYSIIARLKKENVSIARTLLVELNKNAGNNSKIPFDKSLSTHFATGVVLPEQLYGNELLPPTLILATSFWGSADKHLDELIDVGFSGLCELFKNCEDFPSEALTSKRDLKKFFKKHRHWDTFYTGMQYLTKQDIFRENNLRILIESFISKKIDERSFRKSSALEIRQKIQEHVRNQPDFKWASIPWKKTVLDLAVLNWSFILFCMVTAFLIFSPFGSFIFGSLIFKIGTLILIIALLFALILIFSIRKYEKEEQYVASRPKDEVVKAILNRQIYPVLNTMSVSGGLKKGPLRPIFFKIALKAVIMVRGYLTIPTVYTARWLSIDKGKRLVFLSNFMNLSESYVRDFIDNKGSAQKINLLFGQGYGYPVTKWVMGKGALDDPNAFLNEVMTNHHITDLWYCPYQNLSIHNIKTNRLIYQGLFADFSEKEIKNWLKLF